MRPLILTAVGASLFLVQAYDGNAEWEPSDAAPGRERELDLGRDLVVVQYNIWFGEFQYRRRMEAIIAEIARLGADLVCVQEMKPHMLEVFLQSPLVRSTYFITDITGCTLGSYGVVRKSSPPVHFKATCRLSLTSPACLVTLLCLSLSHTVAAGLKMIPLDL